MDKTQFINDAKSKRLSGAYILHGPEEYLKDEALLCAISCIDETSRELNVERMDNTSSERIITVCETMPFFSDKRIVSVSALPTGTDYEALKAYIPNMPESTVLLFFLRGNADAKSGLYKLLTKSGRAVLFDTLSDGEAAKRVLAMAMEMNCPMTSADARFMVELVGTDLMSLSSEFKKAAHYAGLGNPITKQAISACVVKNIEYRVFDMIEYFFSGKTGDGIRALYALFDSGESEFGLTVLIVGRLKQMLKARTLIDKGMNRTDVIRALGGSEYAAGKTFSSASRFTCAELIESTKRFTQIPYRQVTDSLDAKKSLELALIHLKHK